MAKYSMERNQFMLSSGATLGAAQTGLLLILYLTGQLFTSGWGILSWLIYGWLIYHFLKKYRDNYLDGFISYGRGVGFGVRISMYSGVIVGFFYFLMLKVFDPGLQDLLISLTEEAWLAAGMAESTIERMQDAIRQSANPWVFFFSSIVNGIISGLIVALIISIFIKRKGDPFKEAMKDVE